jgi:amino acid transporter
MGKQDQLPAIVAATHPRFKTPYFSVIFNAAIILLLTIYSSFLSALAIATITRLLVYLTTCVALPIFRKRFGSELAGFIAPFGIFISLASTALIVWLLSNVDFTKEGLPIVIAGVVGIGLYFLMKLFRKSAQAEPSG